jgi:hypothetical protein
MKNEHQENENFLFLSSEQVLCGMVPGLIRALHAAVDRIAPMKSSKGRL